MFRHKVFRDRAVARRSRPEPLDARLQVTAPHEWFALAGLSVAVSVLVLWGAFGTVQRTVQAPAVLIAPGERFVVAAPVSGVVIELLAEVGDAVAAGQPIARVRRPDAERQAHITRRLIRAVAEAPAAADGLAAGVRRQVLDAASRELREVELTAAEVIVAPRAGELAVRLLALSQAVEAGETVAQIRAAGSGAWQAFALVSPADAGHIEAGMAAEVHTAPAGAAAPGGLAAQVADVSPKPVAPPAWLEDLGLAAAAPAHLLRLDLSEPPPGPAADGTSGRAQVALAEQSLASLLLAGGGS